MKAAEKLQIEFRSIKKVTVFDVQELPLDELTRRLALLKGAGQPAMLNWAEGVAFISVPFNVQSDMVVEEAVK